MLGLYMQHRIHSASQLRRGAAATILGVSRKVRSFLRGYRRPREPDNEEDDKFKCLQGTADGHHLYQGCAPDAGRLRTAQASQPAMALAP